MVAASAVKPFVLAWMKQAHECGGAYNRPLQGMIPYWHVPRTQWFGTALPVATSMNSAPARPVIT
jgi:hypothetical protein